MPERQSPLTHNFLTRFLTALCGTLWVLLLTNGPTYAQQRDQERADDLGGLGVQSDSAEGLPQYHLAFKIAGGPTSVGSFRTKSLITASPTLGFGVRLDAYPTGGKLGVTTGLEYLRTQLTGKINSSNTSLIQSFEIPLQACYRLNSDSLNSTGLKGALGLLFDYNQYSEFSANRSSSSSNLDRLTVVDTTNRAKILFGASMVYGFPVGRQANVLEIGLNYRQSLGKTLAIVKGLDSDNPTGFQPRLSVVSLVIQFRFARWIDATRNEWQEEEESLEESASL